MWNQILWNHFFDCLPCGINFHVEAKLKLNTSKDAVALRICEAWKKLFFHVTCPPCVSLVACVISGPFRHRRRLSSARFSDSDLLPGQLGHTSLQLVFQYWYNVVSSSCENFDGVVMQRYGIFHCVWMPREISHCAFSPAKRL